MTTGLNLTLPQGGSLARRAAAVPLRLLQWLQMQYRHHRDLRHVAQLDDYLLRDLGLTRDEVTRGLLQPTPWR
ncbi:MAG: DUF1127 domain-containing protein [Kiloniellaceae bacterium]